MAYAELAQLKTAMGISDTADDDLLQIALDAGASLIDQHCNRTFVADSVATVRYFTATSRDRVEVDDIYTTSGLVVTSNNVAVPAEVPYVSTGYVLGPTNAAARGRPYTFLRHTGGSWGSLAWPGFYSGEGSIAVTAKWGFQATVPAAIEQANLLQASRLFSRKNSPYGVTGSPDMGGELRLLAKVDPDVAVLLRTYVRMWAG